MMFQLNSPIGSMKEFILFYMFVMVVFTTASCCSGVSVEMLSFSGFGFDILGFGPLPVKISMKFSLLNLSAICKQINTYLAHQTVVVQNHKY